MLTADMHVYRLFSKSVQSVSLSLSHIHTPLPIQRSSVLLFLALTFFFLFFFHVLIVSLFRSLFKNNFHFNGQ